MLLIPLSFGIYGAILILVSNSFLQLIIYYLFSDSRFRFRYQNTKNIMLTILLFIVLFAMGIIYHLSQRELVYIIFTNAAIFLVILFNWQVVLNLFIKAKTIYLNRS
jgi:hypothetical protein